MYSAKECLADIKLVGKFALKSPFEPCKEWVITMGGFRSLHLPQGPHRRALLSGQQAGERLDVGAAEEEVEVHAARVV